MMPQAQLPDDSTGSEKDPDQFQVWLTTLPYDQPGMAAQILVKELRRLHSASNIRTRLKLLEPAVGPAERLLRETGIELARSSLPMSPEVQQDFLDINALLRTLAQYYSDVTDEIASKWIGIGFAKPLLLAIIRAMQFQAQRLDLAYRVYARGSNSAWAELHRLYRVARNGGFATSTPPDIDATAEQIYLKALLLAFAEPTRLAPGELERVRHYVEQHWQFAELFDANMDRPEEQDASACFLIKPSEARAGRSLVRAARLPIEPGDLILRCARLQTKLLGQLTGLERRIEPDRLGLPPSASEPQHMALLRNLQRLWSAPPVRRHSRQNFKPRVDIVVGFEALITFLSGVAFRRRTAEVSQSALALELSEWAIGNESPGGFAVQYIGGKAGPVRVGEVVGLRPRDESTVHICLMRRVVSNDLQSLELGLQKLAPVSKTTTITVLDQGPKGPALPQPLELNVIMLPRVPNQDSAPALIAPRDVLMPGARIRALEDDQEVTLLVSKPIEQCASCDVFALTAIAE